MMIRLLAPLLVILVCASSCGTDHDTTSLCNKTFVPYQDLTIGQERTVRNSPFLDAMEHYRAGRYVPASDSLEVYLERRDAKAAAHLYLACSYLAMDRPFDAELELDKLKNNTTREFKDQCAWYTVVCWVCSDQLPRALKGAQAIAGSEHHTYSREALELITSLRSLGVE